MSRFSRATRWRLALCAGALVFAIPVETALFAAAGGHSLTGAASDWVLSLSPGELQDATQRIQEFPYFYRRAIMAALEPADRSIAWRRYIGSFVATHPELDPAGRALLNRASALMTPDVFDDEAPAEKMSELGGLFETATGLLGRRTAIDLFMRLGPDDSSFAALPLGQRLTETVRRWITVDADVNDCDCTSAFAESCDASGLAGDACSAASGCDPDVSWPMTGVMWSFPANGVCSTIQRHH